MAETILFWPPVAFVVLLAASILLLWGMGKLSIKPKSQAKGTREPYACGESMPSQPLQPDYGQFLPFAFFFTILHVVALTVTTVPGQTVATFVIATVYVLGAIVGLCVLYTR